MVLWEFLNFLLGFQCVKVCSRACFLEWRDICISLRVHASAVSPASNNELTKTISLPELEEPCVLQVFFAFQFVVFQLFQLSSLSCKQQDLKFQVEAKISCKNVVQGSGVLTFSQLCHTSSHLSMSWQHHLRRDERNYSQRGPVRASDSLADLEETNWLCRSVSVFHGLTATCSCLCTFMLAP